MFFFEKDDSIVRQILDKMTFENCLIILSSPKMKAKGDPIETKFDKVDQYYGTEFIISNYSQAKVQSLGHAQEISGKIFNADSTESITVNDYFIPSENKFVPSNLDMVWPDRWLIVRVRSSYMDEWSEEAFLSDGKNIECKLITSNKRGEMWFKQDRSFLSPVANVKIRIETDKGNISLQEFGIMFFFEEYLAEWIRDNLYEAVDVGYSFEFHSTTNGIEFEINGYNDKISTVIQLLLKSFRHLEMNENEFARVKDKTLTALMLKKSMTLYKIAIEFSKSLILEHNWTFDTLIDICQNITLSHIKSFMENFFDHVYVKSLVHGNMASEQAIQLQEDIEKYLEYGTLENYWNIKEKVRILDGPYAYIYRVLNKEEEDSTIMNSYQLVYLRDKNIDDMQDLLLVSMISSMMSSYAYDYLRTDRLLGYIVSLSTYSVGRVSFLYVLIQGKLKSL